MVKQLNILDLHRCINEKKNRTNECFEKVLDICHKKIQSCANNLKTSCIMEIPCFIAGYPLFDFSKCLEFVYNSLQKNGFLVKYYFPKHFYISWDFEEISKHKKQKVNTSTNSQPPERTTKPPLNHSLKYKPSGKLQLQLD